MGITNQISAALLAVAIGASTCKTGYVTAVKTPYTKKFPFWTFWPSAQHYEIRDTAQVGPTETHPHLWIAHYIIHTDAGAGVDVEAAQERMNDDVDLFMAAFGDRDNSFLGGLVESCGDNREWKNHPDGPFCEFAGRLALGSYGVISVTAPALPFGCL